MTLDAQGPLSATAGQPNAAPASGTTVTDPASAEKGSATASTTGEKGTSTEKAPVSSPETESFFDPKSVSPELMPAYKQMQAAYTKKAQSIADNRRKVEAYDAFMTDPLSQVRSLAAQYGLEIAQPGAKQPQPEIKKDFEPQTWDEVFGEVEKRVMEKFQDRMKPVFDNVQQITAQNIEKQLDSIDPSWKLYEDDMMANIKNHPTLVKDVSKLYRMSVPEEVLTSRAVQQALKKMEDKGKSAQVHGGQSSTKTSSVPKKAATFQEAINQAREEGKAAGWYKT